MLSVLSPATSVAPSRGMLSKQKNIISEQIKKCTIKEVEFNEKDIEFAANYKKWVDCETIEDLNDLNPKEGWSYRSVALEAYENAKK